MNNTVSGTCRSNIMLNRLPEALNTIPLSLHLAGKFGGSGSNLYILLGTLVLKNGLRIYVCESGTLDIGSGTDARSFGGIYCSLQG
jgi:hypothetical protein